MTMLSTLLCPCGVAQANHSCHSAPNLPHINRTMSTLESSTASIVKVCPQLGHLDRDPPEYLWQSSTSIMMTKKTQTANNKLKYFCVLMITSHDHPLPFLDELTDRHTLVVVKLLPQLKSNSVEYNLVMKKAAADLLHFSV